MIAIPTQHMDDQTEAKKIKAALRQTRGTREYARVVAVNIVRVNRQSPTFTAKMLGVDRGTVSDWLDAYECNSLDGFADDMRPGRPPFRSARRARKDSRRRQTVYRLRIHRIGREKDRRKVQRAARAPSAEVAGLRGQEDAPDIRPRTVQGGS